MVDDPNRVPYTGQFGMPPPPPPPSPYGSSDASRYWATHQNNSNDPGAFRSSAANEPAGWTAYGDRGGQFGVGYKDPNNGYHDPNGNFISNDTLTQISGQGVAGDANHGGNQVWGNSDQFFHNNFDVLARNANAVAGGDLNRLQQDVYNRQYLINPLTAQADPSKQYFAGNPDYAAAQQRMMQAQAAGAMGRAAPVIDTSAMQPWQLGAQSSMANMGNQAGMLNLAGGNLNAQGYAMNNVATGAGYQGQIGAAQGLQALGQMPAGPSVAEQAMRMQSAQNERTQAALAAGARGGNSALALNNAAANAATTGGQLQQQIGMQRAQEDMANRQFSAQALGAAGGMYGQAAGTQLGAYGGASNAYGNAASAYGNAGNLYGNVGALGLQGAGQMGNIAQQNAGNALQQTQLNQTYGLGSQQLGADYMKSQLNATVQADANRTQNATNIAANRYANRDRTGEGTITGSAGGDKVLGAGASALGTAFTGPMSDMRAKKDVKPATGDVSNAFRNFGSAFTPTVDNVVAPRGMTVMPQVSQQIDYGGPPAGNAADVRMALQRHPLDANMMASKEAIWPGSRNQLYGMASSADLNAPPAITFGTNGLSDDLYSDMRAKKDIEPASRQIGDAFRTAGRAVSDIGGTTVQYPQSTAAFPDVGAYSYHYKNPGALGAAPGTHYGPMAQELEQTPAGASVVGEDKKGRKFVDPGRLSMLTASEVAKQRKELDALKSMPGAITSPQVVYPQLGAPPPAIPDLHEAMAMGGQIRNTQVPYPTPAPVYRLGGV